MGLQPIRVITVEREYGSRGGEFAHHLADRLGWRLLDDELLKGAARTAGVPEETAAEFDDRLDPWYYRYGKLFWQDSFYSGTVPCDDKVFDCARMYALIRKEMEEAGRIGNCVLVGRGAASALAGWPGCFHAFVYATQAAKREWFQKKFPEEAQQAEQRLAAHDKRRAAVIKQFYGQEWNARSMYHLLLNSSIGSEGMIAATAAAAGLKVGAAAEALAR
ncbi:MAG TPA: cytidylate kinase-like family protein [Terracidiphilus sp.]